MSIPAGITLHNPGDLERNGDRVRYDGEIVPSRDPVLKEFISDEWGLRAILECFYTYIVKDSITTLGAAIERYAPPTENDTVAYQAAVCTGCAATNDTPFTVAWLKANSQGMLNSITQREVSVVYPLAVVQTAIGLMFEED